MASYLTTVSLLLQMGSCYLAFAYKVDNVPRDVNNQHFDEAIKI